MKKKGKKSSDFRVAIITDPKNGVKLSIIQRFMNECLEKGVLNKDRVDAVFKALNRLL